MWTAFFLFKDQMYAQKEAQTCLLTELKIHLKGALLFFQNGNQCAVCWPAGFKLSALWMFFRMISFQLLLLSEKKCLQKKPEKRFLWHFFEKRTEYTQNTTPLHPMSFFLSRKIAERWKCFMSLLCQNFFWQLFALSFVRCVFVTFSPVEIKKKEHSQFFFEFIFSASGWFRRYFNFGFPVLFSFHIFFWNFCKASRKTVQHWQLRTLSKNRFLFCESNHLTHEMINRQGPWFRNAEKGGVQFSHSLFQTKKSRFGRKKKTEQKETLKFLL